MSMGRAAPSPIRVDVARARVVPLRRSRRTTAGDAGRRDRAASLLETVAASALSTLTVFCGAVGLTGLVGSMADVPYDAATSAAGFALCLPVCLTAAAAPRRVGWGMLATLALCAAALWAAWDPVSQQLGAVAESLSGSGPSSAGDATAAMCALCALASCTLSCLALVANLGWACALLCVPLLLLCPQIGCRPDTSVVLALLAYHAGALALGQGNGRFRRTRASVLALALGLAAASFWGAGALVYRFEYEIAAPPKAVDARVVEAVDAVGDWLSGQEKRQAARDAGESVSAEPSVAAALDGSGEVARGPFEPSALGAVAAVSLSAQPRNTLYLAYFHGSSYRGGTWEEDGESAARDDGFTAGWRAVAAGTGLRELSLAIVATSSAAETGELLPYARLSGGDPADASGTSPRGYTVVDFGSADTLAGFGVALAATPAASPSVPSAWTQVPLDKVPRLARLVEENPQEDLASAVAFVRATLAESAVYTTEPAEYPAGVDVAEHLVFDGHEGYCQHFATAATLMLRLYGVPARYVTGFALAADSFEERADGTWAATAEGANAHAWVEVYTAELGWVPVEVTPSDGGQNGGQDSTATQPADPVDASPDEATDPADGNRSEPDASAQRADSAPDEASQDAPDAYGGAAPSRDGASAAPPTAKHVFAMVAAAAGAVFLVVACIALALRRRRAAERRARVSADALMAELIRALQFAGLLEGCTGSEADLAQRLDEAVPAIGPESCRRIVAEAQRSAFGPDGPTPAGDGLRQAYGTACACARAQLGWLGCLSFRYLRNFD